jgi:aminocarboxymuconate-semialdehyde decarboxylase
MPKRPIAYFQMFYGDTVIGGFTPALRCGMDFFGADRVMFASDCPFDPEGGPMFIRENMRAVEELGLPPKDQRKILCENALEMFRLQ